MGVSPSYYTQYVDEISMGTVIGLIQNPIKHDFTNFSILQNVQSKFKKVAKNL